VVNTREQRLRQRLEAQFQPVELVITNESHLHAGHAGAAGGLGHFRVQIVAASFAGLSTLARHRLVYAAVGDLMQTDIHALSLQVGSPQVSEKG